jgi:photosystem II stability/assembly factor-like uncharacterized protein
LDVLILAVVGIGLLTAALYSETITGRAADEVADLVPPPIQWRDQFLGVAAPAPGVIWMAGSGGKVVRSEDGGQSWSIQETGVTENLQGIDAWDPDRAIAVGNDGVVLVTADGGDSWTRVEAPRSEIANKLIRVRCADGGEAWAVGVMGTILHSEDWGASWQRRAEEVDVAWNDIAFADEQNLWVVGEFGSMMHSPDAGATWQEVEPASERSLMGLSFRDARTAVAVGLDGLVLRTLDAGLSWTPVDAGTPLHLFDVVWDGAEWIAVGGMGVVVTGSENGDSWRAQRLSERDLAWHTALVPTGDGVYVAGASQGSWRTGQWTPAGLG